MKCLNHIFSPLRIKSVCDSSAKPHPGLNSWSE